MNSSWHKISSNPYVHIIIAAFIAGAIPILDPVIQHGNWTLSVVKVAIGAGIGAVLRAVFLLVPTQQKA